MTQKQAAIYAGQCRKAKTLAGKTGTQYVKPERPDASQIETIESIASVGKRNIRAISYRINVISIQMDMLLDFISEITAQNPQYREYELIADYLNGSIIEIEELLKTI